MAGRLRARLARLEHADDERQLRERAAWLSRRVGEDPAKLLPDLRHQQRRWRRLSALHALPLPNGLLDLEPALRAYAAEMGLDADALVRGAEEVAAEMEAERLRRAR